MSIYIKRWLQRLRRPLISRSRTGRQNAEAAHRKIGTSALLVDGYTTSVPRPQNEIDLIPGWNHALPPEVGASAGPISLFKDARIEWALEQFGSIAGRRVLELGPLEASHTYMLHMQRPALIRAIESNKLAFMRCLVVKNLLDLDAAHFMLGDFQKWLEISNERYDLIVASGVLYHLADPVRLIELMSARSDALYIWSHYFNNAEMPEGDVRRLPFSGEVQARQFEDLSIRLHKRSYHGAWKDKAFCGGIYDEHSWMEKEQILTLLERVGYNDIRTTHEAPDHPNGPALSIFARRTSS
jgi:hypothetical protein